MVSKLARAALLAALSLMLLTVAFGADQKLTTDDDLEVYYGSVPGEVVKKQLPTDAPKHKGRVRPNDKHLVVALYDQKTGERITDARVTATVTPLGLAPMKKRLEPMRLNDTISYGNFFDFAPEGGPFQIHVEVARANHPTQDVSFAYRP